MRLSAPTEAELQAIVRAAYEKLLSELCQDQRSTPYRAQIHSAADHSASLFELTYGHALIEAGSRYQGSVPAGKVRRARGNV